MPNNTFLKEGHLYRVKVDELNWRYDGKSYRNNILLYLGEKESPKDPGYSNFAFLLSDGNIGYFAPDSQVSIQPEYWLKMTL